MQARLYSEAEAAARAPPRPASDVLGGPNQHAPNAVSAHSTNRDGNVMEWLHATQDELLANTK